MNDTNTEDSESLEEQDADMAKDVEENAEMYEALADETGREGADG